MGCCISKCRPDPAPHRECLLPQDKLVFSQAPTTPTDLPLPNKYSNETSFSSPSSSSFSCTTSVTTSSCSLSTSSSSSSSSILVSKDRSYSNEFLWSCVKENPHIARVDQAKSVPVKFPARKLESPSQIVLPPSKQSVQPRQIGLPPQKRGRDNSPTLVRQKSFRKECERPNSTSSLPRRNLSSPSPCRRFNGDVCRGIPANSPKRSRDRNIGLKSNADAVKSISSYVRKENLRPKSLSNNVSRDGFRLRKRETCSHQVHPEVDRNSIAESRSNQECNFQPMDDINNPHISLDCFIFL